MFCCVCFVFFEFWGLGSFFGVGVFFWVLGCFFDVGRVLGPPRERQTQNVGLLLNETIQFMISLRHWGMFTNED